MQNQLERINKYFRKGAKKLYNNTYGKFDEDKYNSYLLHNYLKRFDENEENEENEEDEESEEDGQS